MHASKHEEISAGRPSASSQQELVKYLHVCEWARSDKRGHNRNASIPNATLVQVFVSRFSHLRMCSTHYYKWKFDHTWASGLWCVFPTRRKSRANSNRSWHKAREVEAFCLKTVHQVLQATAERKSGSIEHCVPQEISFFSTTVQSSNVGFTGQSYTFFVWQELKMFGVFYWHTMDASPQESLCVTIATAPSPPPFRSNSTCFPLTTAPIKQKSAIKLAYSQRILNLGLEVLNTGYKVCPSALFPNHKYARDPFFLGLEKVMQDPGMKCVGQCHIFK